jgi:hypothetical protein
MRVVRSENELEAALRATREEAGKAFADDAVYIEKYIDRPRHIEIQIMADAHGNVIHLGERECSVQRRHQKVLEEAPSPVISAEERMRATLSRVAAVNGPLNAVVSLRDEAELLAEARAADAGPARGPLHGLPIAIKDLVDAAGLPTSQGSPAFAGQVAQSDSLHVARLRAAGATASAQALMSPAAARARPQITGPSGVPTASAMRCTALKSPGLAKGKPASMMSTPRRASCWAIASFSSRFRLAPGDCSPSRRVVSKIRTRPGSRAISTSLCGTTMS